MPEILLLILGFFPPESVSVHQADVQLSELSKSREHELAAVLQNKVGL